MWSAQVWPKVKAFGWKFITNSIAVRGNLQRRGIQVSASCPACEEDETTEHMLFGCLWAWPVWRDVLGVTVEGRESESVTAWLGALLLAKTGNTRRDKYIAAMALIVGWCVWKVRCKMAFKDRLPNTGGIIQEAFRTFGESRVQLNVRSTTVRTVDRKPWSAPDVGCIKLNCDTSWEEATGRGGLGVIARDHDGRICGGCSGLGAGKLG